MIFQSFPKGEKVKSCKVRITLLSLPLLKRAKDKAQPIFNRDVIKPLQ